VNRCPEARRNEALLRSLTTDTAAAPGSGFAVVFPSDSVSAVARSRSGRSRQCVGEDGTSGHACMKMVGHEKMVE